MDAEKCLCDLSRHMAVDRLVRLTHDGNERRHASALSVVGINPTSWHLYNNSICLI